MCVKTGNHDVSMKSLGMQRKLALCMNICVLFSLEYFCHILLMCLAINKSLHVSYGYTSRLVWVDITLFPEPASQTTPLPGHCRETVISRISVNVLAPRLQDDNVAVRFQINRVHIPSLPCLCLSFTVLSFTSPLLHRTFIPHSCSCTCCGWSSLETWNAPCTHAHK